MNSGMFTSNTDLWETPQVFFNELNKEFKFELDVCADETNHKCKQYFTKEQDGLLHEWKGRCWMNHHTGERLENGLKKHQRATH